MSLREQSQMEQLTRSQNVRAAQVVAAWSAVLAVAVTARGDQSAAAEQFKRVYASVTLDADKNITAIDFSDADYSDKDLALVAGLPKLDSLVITGSAFTDRSIAHVCGLG